jgi:hypothetical protein
VARQLRIIQMVHSVPGRTRLRLGWLRETPDEAEALADHLAGLDPSIEVRVRPWTGSVLCTYDPERLDADAIAAAVRRHTGVAIVLRPGETHPETQAPYRREENDGSVRKLTREAFRALDHDIVRATGGRLDLGSLTGIGFLAVGAAEILAARALPAPPWFNLAWWAYRTFTTTGGADEEEEEASDAAESATGD